MSFEVLLCKPVLGHQSSSLCTRRSWCVEWEGRGSLKKPFHARAAFQKRAVKQMLLAVELLSMSEAYMCIKKMELPADQMASGRNGGLRPVVFLPSGTRCVRASSSAGIAIT